MTKPIPVFRRPRASSPAGLRPARVRRGRRAALALGAIAIASAAALGLARSGAPRAPGLDTGSASVLAGYPGPPSATPAPSATPGADAQGYLPPPTGGPTQTLLLGDSPYADLLLPLQDALLAGDSSPAASLVTERFGLTLFDIRYLDGEGGSALDGDRAAALLQDAFDAGASPRLQGYFEVGDAVVPCLELLVWSLGDALPHPAAGTPVSYGPRPASPLRGDAAAWRACRAQDGVWIWQRWGHGGYHEIVETLFARPQGGDGTYTVLRPSS